MTLKQGAAGQEVIELQRALGVAADGVFGSDTAAAVMEFQRENGLVTDGIAGPQTLTAIRGMNVTTDNSETVYQPVPDLTVHTYFLPRKEYFDGPVSKEYLILHHTAGWHNPYSVIDGWARDDRGPVACEFVLGGRSVRGDDDRHDGELVQCIPEGGYGWHLGKNGSPGMHTHSVGIELCNFSYAVEGKTYTGTPIDREQLVILPEPFRGHRYWHAYSESQINVLRRVILWIADRDSIDIRKGIVSEIRQKGPQAFEYNDDAYHGRTKGMWTHANIRKDKFDLFPQPELIDMLTSL